jgi:hypothetical protein
MSNYSISEHSEIRMAQRAIFMSDVELIATFGTECADGYVFLERDCHELERELKANLQRIAQLRGMRIVEVGGHLVTAYHANQRKTKELGPKRRKCRSLQ